MRISVASDHRGVQLKERLVNQLLQHGHHVSDEGPDTAEGVDYPDFAAIVARKVSCGEADRGILICGTGIGMAIAANKFRGVRAATVHDEISAEMSRRHNDINVLCLPADLLGSSNSEKLVSLFLQTDFEGGRHARRVGKIRDLEHLADSPLPEANRCGGDAD